MNIVNISENLKSDDESKRISNSPGTIYKFLLFAGRINELLGRLEDKLIKATEEMLDFIPLQHPRI